MPYVKEPLHKYMQDFDGRRPELHIYLVRRDRHRPYALLYETEIHGLRTEKEYLIIRAPVSLDAFPVTGDVLSEGGGVGG